MSSFAAELRTNFPLVLQNSHVIDQSQVLIGALAKSKSGRELSFTYNSRDNDKMLIDLGESIYDIIKPTPDGVLIFFPSYFLMDKTDKLWESNGIKTKMDKLKPVYVEPRESCRFKRIRNDFQNDIESNRGAVLIGV